MKTHHLLFSMLVSTLTLAQSFDFSTGKPEDYFASGPMKAGPQSMILDNNSTELHPIPVSPETAYTLTLEASFAGEVESFEDNPRFDRFLRQRKTSAKLPLRQLVFFDADGNRIKATRSESLAFRDRHVYQTAFYTPANAVSMRIRFSAKNDIQLSLFHLTLEKEVSTETLNLNPSFGYGPNNYSGWYEVARGGKLFEVDGKTILDTKYGTTGDKIPITQPGTYAFTAIATKNGYNSVVIARVFNADGKELMRSATRKHGSTKYFVPPPDAAYVSFLVYSCLLEELHFKRVGDEDAIVEFLKKP